jgi:hypothetical protein
MAKMTHSGPVSAGAGNLASVAAILDRIFRRNVGRCSAGVRSCPRSCAGARADGVGTHGELPSEVDNTSILRPHRPIDVLSIPQRARRPEPAQRLSRQRFSCVWHSCPVRCAAAVPAGIRGTCSVAAAAPACPYMTQLGRIVLPQQAHRLLGRNGLSRMHLALRSGSAASRTLTRIKPGCRKIVNGCLRHPPPSGGS